MTLADITVVPVPTGRRTAYVEFSRRMAAVYLDHGATSVVDYWQTPGETGQDEFHAAGTDYAPGQLRGLAATVGAGDGESVVVSITSWPSRAARDQGNAAALEDPRVRETLDQEPVFDGRRLVADSFEVAVTALGAGPVQGVS